MFKGILVMAVLGACVYFAVRGPASHEAVMKNTLSIYEEMTDILSKITDEKSAVLARPKLEGLGKEIDDLKRSADNLDPATPQEVINLENKFAPKLQKVMTELFSEMTRLSKNPTVSQRLAGALPLITIPSVTPTTASTNQREAGTTQRASNRTRRVPS